MNGAVAETTKLLEQKWDHIFYTGNGTVGRIIMGAAAKQLCPVTLELGGKSPTIIDKTSDLYVTARRLVYCKYFNAGQICIAPDYVILLDGVDEAKFLAQVKAAMLEFYGEDPKNSTSFARIINGNHFNRLKPLLASGTVAIGGQIDEATKYIAPTVLTDVSPDSLVMKDEIFGPILPIIKQKTLDDAIDFINSRDRPLALYYFSNDTAALKKVGNETTSGAYVTNDCVMHFTVASLPFGGVGPSGMGAYHSKRRYFICFFLSRKLNYILLQALTRSRTPRPPCSRTRTSRLSTTSATRPTPTARARPSRPSSARPSTPSP